MARARNIAQSDSASSVWCLRVSVSCVVCRVLQHVAVLSVLRQVLLPRTHQDPAGPQQPVGYTQGERPTSLSRSAGVLDTTQVEEAQRIPDRRYIVIYYLRRPRYNQKIVLVFLNLYDEICFD